MDKVFRIGRSGLLVLLAGLLSIAQQGRAQTAIPNPLGINPTLTCTGGLGSMGFATGQTFTYTYAAGNAMPACTGWGIPTTLQVAGNSLSINAAWNNSTFPNSGSAPHNTGTQTNLSAGVAVFSGSSTVKASNGSVLNNYTVQTKLILTVTVAGVPAQLQNSGGFVFAVLPAGTAHTLVVNVKLQGYGPSGPVYATSGTGAPSLPCGNTYTCANWTNQWQPFLQLFNCMATDNTLINTQFPGTASSYQFVSGVQPAAPNAIIGETTLCIGSTTTLTSPLATGGEITNVGGYRIHAFYANGTFNMAQNANVEVLVVGGGGGGGMDMGGGGGGGGVIANSSFPMLVGSYPVTVGAGGYGAPPGSAAGQPGGHQFTVPATNGGNSVFSTLTAIGGGRGGSSHWPYTPGGPGSAGGSGGGASGYSSTNGAGGGAGTAGQGFAGGNGGGSHYSGGGGGAGGAGSSGPGLPHGGAGVLNAILGTSYYWGGGGGGASYSGCGGNGGIGGGGGGAVCTTTGGAGLNNGAGGGGGTINNQTNRPGGNAGANTGGGGGGGSHYNINNGGGNGGSGIVVVRYLEGAGSGQWTSSVPAVATVHPTTGVVTAIAAGTTVISYAVMLGTCSSVPATTTVTILPDPAAPTASNVTICAGQSTTISATSAGNLIKWYSAASGGSLVGVTASGATLSVTPGSTTTYYAEAVSNNPYATGGTVTTSGAYRIHSFLSSGTLTMVQGGKTEALVVAGGGGGGSDMGGGGGGGGVIRNNAFTVAAGSFPITVGAGGGGAAAGIGQAKGANGGNSVFSSLTAIGGGGGASCHDRSTSPAGNGGSGGGASGGGTLPSGGSGGGGYGGGIRGLGTAGQGYDGSSGIYAWFPGGGGGAGGPGSVRVAHGGPGVASSILGTQYYFGGGGGGAGYSGNGGNGGKGGGGGGAIGITLGGTGGLNNGSNGTYGNAVAQSNVPGGNAGANTGGGGGGGAHYSANNYGGSGGSGIVVVRYIDDGCSSAARTPVTVTVVPLPAAPTPATATPSTVCQYANTTLNATSAGNTIKWYNAAVGGTLLGTSASGANIVLAANTSPTTTFYAEASTPTGCLSATRTPVVVTVNYMPATLAPLTGEQNITCGGTTVFSNAPTGGNITTSGAYRIHSFLANGTFAVPSSFLGTVDVLVVGGGGGGGSDMGGGGGGGGVIYNTGFAVTPGSNIAVTVGAGGNGALNGTNQARGANGGNSVFSSLTAIGGGGGASDHDAAGSPAGAGGSGGGASGRNANAGAGTAGQGNSGSNSAGSWYPGGGGGAGGAGGTNPANGGPGVSNAILGTAYYWGAGGGGAGYSNIAGNGGLGGGGGGAPKVGAGGNAGTGGLNAGSNGNVGLLNSQTNVPGGSGAPNTGAGGGGGAHYNDGNHGGNGGSGIVVVRYPNVTNGIWSSSNTSIATVDANGVVTGIGTGTATITYQLTNGSCNSATTVTRTVTVSLPTLAPITGTTTVCPGASSSLLLSSPKATGGIESVVGGYRIHKFLANGTLNVSRSGNMEVLVVAGGGGGGTNMGGGGGGGGVIANPSFPVSAGSIAITVGAGGNGAPAGLCNNPQCHPTVPAVNGGNSSFGVLTAIGGGAGGTSYNSLGIQRGSNGGSGGGASGYNDNGAGPGWASGGMEVPGQGFAGGNQGTAYYSGGGGGAGGQGSSGNAQANGGPGVLNSILGTAYYWAGGGGGSAYSAATGGNGGIGGGGGGAVGTTTGGAGLNNGSAGGGGCSNCWANTPGGDAGANTGGGGGGAAHYYSGNKGGNGGSGIVIVKYLDGANGTWSSSNASVATIDPNTGVVTGVAAGTTTITYQVTIGSCVASQTTTVTVSNTAITSATSTPASICDGSTANLNAVSAGNTINWYTAATGGTLLGTTASAVNFPVTPSSTTTYYAEAITTVTGTQTFSYSGGVQTFIVPPYVTGLTIDAYGAQGSNAQTVGGAGGRAQGTLAVTPGQTLYVYVGGQNGFNGGGPPGVGGTYPGAYGGGASDIRVGGIALANRVIVAGAGGGGGTAGASWGIPGPGGVGGGNTGGTPTLGGGWIAPSGGTQVGGGVVGISCGNCSNTATNGSLGQGGRGDYACSTYGTGSGGGGGYYGGAGGESCGNGEPGGGGSSYIGGVTAGSTTAGVRAGNGQITISWNGPGCVSSPRTAVNVPVTAVPANLTPSASATTICNGSSTTVQVPGSESGVNYQLRNDAGNINVGSAVAGNGGTINLPTGNLTGTTTFNILATNTTSLCARELSTLVTVTVYSNLSGGTFIYTNTTGCTTSNGTLTVSGVSGGSGSFRYSINSTDGANGTWTNTTGSFTGIAVGSGQVWVRNTNVPYCPVYLGAYTIYEPYSPIATPTASNNLPDLCNGNIATLTATGLAPGNGGSNAANGARNFNGGQYMSSATSAGLPTGSVATVEAWVKRNALADASFNGIVAWGPRTCGTSLLFSMKSDGRLSMATWCSDIVPNSGPAVPASVWTHVAMVVNGTSVQFYINGQPAQSGTIAAPNIQAAAGQTLTIGCTDVYGRYFNGLIDNVRIWASARTQAELQADMHRQVPTTNVAALRAHYTFNGGSLANASGPGPALTAATATTTSPAHYTYTWSGGLPAGTVPTGANPASSTNEVQTSGTITGTSPFQVIATANGCTSSQSNVAPSNDFAGGYTVTLEAAGTGNALAVAMPGNQGSTAYGTRQVAPATFAGLETGAITSATWNRCLNWGLPTTSTPSQGPRVGWVPGSMINMDYLTSTAANSTTDLANGKICYTAFLTPPASKFCTNATCTAFLSTALQLRLTITVLTTGGTAIPLDYVSSGHIVMRAAQNFKLRAFLEVYAPAAQYYGVSRTTGSGGTCNNYSTPNTWYPALEWYDCMYKNAAPNLAYSFNYSSFPKFNGIGVDVGPDLNICAASTINLVANVGTLSATCGPLLHHWEGPAGYSTGTLAAPTGSTTGSVTAQTTPTNTYGTYYYTVSQSPSNICYATDNLVVTANVPVADNINFPSPPNNTNLTTHWKTILDPLGTTGPNNWFDNDNWTHCVPNLGVNAMIYQTINPTNDPLYQPIISSPGAAASAVTIETDNGAKLTIDAGAGGTLQIDQ